MARRFERKQEDFICGNCGYAVRGNGYTNHCPTCLWSRHVDVNPGDRASMCGGPMEPVGVELKKGVWVIRHRCVLCGFERKNRTTSEDNFDTILRISTSQDRKI